MAQMEKITGGRTTGEKVKTGILGFFLNFFPFPVSFLWYGCSTHP